MTSSLTAPIAPAAPLTPSTSTPSVVPSLHAHDANGPTSTPRPPGSLSTVETPEARSTLDSSRGDILAPPARHIAVSSAPSSANTPVSTFTRTSRVETQTVNVSGNFYFHSEHRLASEAGAVTRSVTHKTRLFGQSHWVNAFALARLPLSPRCPYSAIIIQHIGKHQWIY